MTRRIRRDGIRRSRDGVGLVFTCAVCGRPVELTSDESGVVIADRVQFLEVHRSCLSRRETRLGPGER